MKMTIMKGAKVARNTVSLNRMFECFPKGITMAFAHGSGVFQQTNKIMSQRILDLIFVVKDPLKWHTDNLSANKHHYDYSLSWFNRSRGPSMMSASTGLHYNTLVPIKNRIINYGVIAEDRLVSDLIDWDTLHVSGRLHKPVKMIIKPSSNVMTGALTTNLESAVLASLLSLPEHFSEEWLFHQIAGLSYTIYTPRGQLKVRNLVSRNIDNYRELYQPILTRNTNLQWSNESQVYEQNKEYDVQIQQLQQLPNNVLLSLAKVSKKTMNNRGPMETEELLHRIATNKNGRFIMRKSLDAITTSSKMHQTINEIKTAGMVKTLKYRMAKRSKKLFKTEKKENSKIHDKIM